MKTINLEREGRTFVGQCPHHKDKKPTLTADPNSGAYYCHACKNSGNFLSIDKADGLTVGVLSV